MKKKFISIVVALTLLLSLLAIPTIVSAAEGYEPTIGWWASSEPLSGTAEFSTSQAHSGSSSAHLEAYIAYSKDDYHEVYVANPTGIDTLADLSDVSFWYYCPAGDNGVMPLIDVWLDLDGSYDREAVAGDEEWLLGMIADVATFNAWVEVTAADITWVRAMGGTVYGVGAAGLNVAKAEEDTTNIYFAGPEVYATLGDCPILAIGVETGGPGTYISSRTYDQEFYIDDIAINTITYDLGFNTVVGMTAEVEEIIAISVDPTDIDFGAVTPGASVSGGDITVANIGTVTVAVNAYLEPTSEVFAGLSLNGVLHPSSGAWSPGDLGMNAIVPTSSEPCATALDVPATYSAQGVETATLIFIATAQ